MCVARKSASIAGSRILLAATSISVGNERDRLTNSLNRSSADRINACTFKPSGLLSSIVLISTSKNGSLLRYFFTEKRDMP